MAIPEPLEAPTSAEYLALISRAIFQAGLSWKMIEGRWPHYLRLFEGFDPLLVAAFDSTDVDRILADGNVVRTRKKIDATIENARALLELERSHGGVRGYVRSFSSYAELAADMRKRLKFLGELSVYYVLFLASEAVPPFEEWSAKIPGDHPRMREMVELARSKNRSPERAGI